MKKQMILVTIAVAAVFLFMYGPAMAGPYGAVHLNWGYYLNDSDTACPAGKPLINVTRKITNSLDSGTGQNIYGNSYWAYSDFVQHIKVVETADGFCAIVTYLGKVESVGGDGPGCATDDNDVCDDKQGLEEGVVATFQGGYTMNITGAFDPQLPTKGNLGTFDANCDAVNGECDFSPTYGWINDYFNEHRFSFR
jgi:hypothetical protein